MKYLNKVVNVLLVIALYSSPAMVYAAGPGFKDDVKTWGDDDDHWHQDDHGDDDYNDDDNYEIPLDGGLSLLAAAGGAYAIKRVRDKKAKK